MRLFQYDAKLHIKVIEILKIDVQTKSKIQNEKAFLKFIL